MLAQDKVAMDTLRGIKKEFLEAKTAKGNNGELSDEQAVKILQKMMKQRKESAEMYNSANRQELAENEMAQVTIIEKYLPDQMSEDELVSILKEIISQTGASSMKEMGKVMGIASRQLAGKADGRVISEKVKQLLG
ncbi:MAG TPA: glutamyl-tRNA amidotransferase [Bacteroidales bacterium]|nr:glutamyl-tRNA amidotransferase [Bacteroidales bacterium]